MLGVIGMANCQSASHLGLNSQLRVAQWIALLSRLLFSCFSDGYAFVRMELGGKEQYVPQAVIGEMLLFVCLFPLAGAALDRPWNATIVATDAAPQYEFGV